MIHHIWVAVVVLVGIVATIFNSDGECHLHYYMLQEYHTTLRAHTELDLEWCTTRGIAERGREEGGR